MARYTVVSMARNLRGVFQRELVIETAVVAVHVDLPANALDFHRGLIQFVEVHVKREFLRFGIDEVHHVFELRDGRETRTI